MTRRDESYWIRHETAIHAEYRKYASYYRDVMINSPPAELPDDFEHRVHSLIGGYAASIPLHAGGPRAFFNKLMPVLAMMAAVHAVLRQECWTVDQIGRLSYEVFRRRFDEIPRIGRFVARRLMVSALFPRLMAKGTRAMRRSSRPDTFYMEYSFRKKPESKTTMTCTQCGMIQYMKAVGLEEMYRYCNIFDFAQADSFGLGLIQPSCIGRGDDTCVYHFTRNPEDTRYPDSVRRILQTELEN